MLPVSMAGSTRIGVAVDGVARLDAPRVDPLELEVAPRHDAPQVQVRAVGTR
jgi:hypothetical protein